MTVDVSKQTATVVASSAPGDTLVVSKQSAVAVVQPKPVLLNVVKLTACVVFSPAPPPTGTQPTMIILSN